jgi:hypothetical protein
MDAYGSHVPVLIDLARQHAIRTVLECGAGWYSTPTFLDRLSFPDVMRLVSLEDIPRWYEGVKGVCDPDTRWELWKVDDMARAVDGLDLSEFDLIMIDNGQTADERVAVIEAVVSQHPHGLIVIHDYENPAYAVQEAGCEVRVYRADARLPATAVVKIGVWDETLSVA